MHDLLKYKISRGKKKMYSILLSLCFKPHILDRYANNEKRGKYFVQRGYYLLN